MKTIKTLIVGLGQIGMLYDVDAEDDFILTHVRGFSKHSSFEIVGGIDPSVENRSLLMNKYYMPSWTSFEEFYKTDILPDLIVISSPTSRHLESVTEAVRLNPKLLIVEKPMGQSFEEAHAILKIADKTPVLVNYLRRFDPIFESFLPVLKDAETFRGNVYYCKGIKNIGSHFINLMQMLAGNSREVKLIDPGKNLPNGDSNPEFRITYNRGIVHFLPLPEIPYDHYQIDIYSDKGQLSYNGDGSEAFIRKIMSDPLYPNYMVLGPKENIQFDTTRVMAPLVNSVADMFKRSDFNTQSNIDSVLETWDVMNRVNALRGITTC